MLKVYQFELSTEEGDLVNSKGWSASPKTTAYADKGFKGYQSGTAEYYKYVANVYTNDLEESFRLMNLWEDYSLVKFVNNERPYSMSVGDVVQTEDGEFYAVAGCGFDKINPNEFASFTTQEKYATSNA